MIHAKICLNIFQHSLRKYKRIHWDSRKKNKKRISFQNYVRDEDKDIPRTWKIKSILKLTGCICENDKLIFITIYYIINFRDDKKTLLLNTYEKLMKKSIL